MAFFLTEPSVKYQRFRNSLISIYKVLNSGPNITHNYYTISCSKLNSQMKQLSKTSTFNQGKKKYNK